MMYIRGLIQNNRIVFENIFYVGVLQLVTLIVPLITYPYLVRVLGREPYGLVLSAQMLASYASLVIEFGSNSVSAKHVSINRDNNNKLSEIFSSIICTRGLLFIVSFVIYSIVVFSVPVYRKNFLLFLLFYGITINNVLFPQYFFQGLEKMKFITIISTITKLIFVSFIYIFVKSADDIFLVPILYTIGYSVGGFFAIWIIIKQIKIPFRKPSFSSMAFYVKDSSAIFATDLICTIKDKLNYMLVGLCVGMGDVVIYDLGLTVKSLATKPLEVICMVLFPRFAKDHNVEKVKKIMLLSFVLSLIIVISLNIFMPFISNFFLHESVDLLPLRLFSLAPLFLSTSSIISSNVFVAWGYNKYVFYSIIVTTISYITALLFAFVSHTYNSLFTFVIIALISYMIELIYRLIVAKKVFRKEKVKSTHNYY